MVDFRRNVFCLLGLPLDAINMADTVRRVRDAAARRTPCLLSTPNTNWVVDCLGDGRFRDSTISSDLNVVDGRPLVWIARLLDIPIPEPVPGSTLFDWLRRLNGRQLSVFFFGGVDGAAEKACRRLRMENQGLTCVGFDAAGFGSVEDMSRDEVIRRINMSKADFLVVALGAKKGQAWIERNRERVSVPLVSYLGAVVNFAADTVRRAPAWVQRMGFEWLWRIKEEPVLWRRYFRGGVSLLALLATRVVPYAWYLRRNRHDAGSLSAGRVEARDERDEYVITLSGIWTRENLAPVRECYATASMAGKHVRLDLHATTYVDSAFVGLTILLQGSQKRRGRAFQIVGARETVRRVVRYCCAEYLFASYPVGLQARAAETLRRRADEQRALAMPGIEEAGREHGCSGYG